jgi:hypothetical protein
VGSPRAVSSIGAHPQVFRFVRPSERGDKDAALDPVVDRVEDLFLPQQFRQFRVLAEGADEIPLRGGTVRPRAHRS